MACRIFGAKPLCKPMMIYCDLDPKEHNSNAFIQGNANENIVCETTAICLALNVLKGGQVESNSPSGQFIVTNSRIYMLYCT